MSGSSTERNTPRSRIRHSLVVSFDSPEGRTAFKSRVEHVRSLLTPPGQPSLDNNGLMSAIFDHVERFAPVFPGTERASAVQSFNRDSGKCLATSSSGVASWLAGWLLCYLTS
jgi:hypothetical protein